MASFFKLIRYQNLLMIVLTMCLIHYALLPSFSHHVPFSSLWFIYLVVSVNCVTSGGYIINDLYDVEADKINKPTKVFIGTSIAIGKARLYYVVLTGSGIGLGTYLSMEVESSKLSLFFLAAALLLFLYSRFLKRLVLLGNLLIGVLVSLPIFMVYVFETLETPKYYDLFELLAGVFSSISMHFIILYYMFFSFLTTLIRELIKDIEDINGDYHMNMKTLPIVLGVRRTRNVAVFFSIVLMISLIIISKAFIEEPSFFWIGAYNYMFLVVPLLYFIYLLWRAKTRKQFSFLSNYMKWIMFVGIMSIMIFKF